MTDCARFPSCQKGFQILLSASSIPQKQREVQRPNPLPTSSASARSESDIEGHLGLRGRVVGDRVRNTCEIPEDGLLRAELELEAGHESGEDDL